MDRVQQLFQGLLSSWAQQEALETGNFCGPPGSEHCRRAWTVGGVLSGPGSAHTGPSGAGLSGGVGADGCSFQTPADLGCSTVRMFVDISSLFPPRVASGGWRELGFGGIEDLALGWWGCRRAGGLSGGGSTGC